MLSGVVGSDNSLTADQDLDGVVGSARSVLLACTTTRYKSYTNKWLI